MKAIHTLPEGYKEVFSVDLQKNRKLAVFINILALGIGVVLAVPMHFYIPFTTLFEMEQGVTAYLVRFGVLLVSMVAYMVLHELVHGIAMKLCGTDKVKYGFTGLYAFAGSEDYYGKNSYIGIALAPVVIWGIVLGVITALVPDAWFWVVYMLQIVNLSGAAGDAYVTVKFAGFPKDILVRDSGVSMTVYSRSEG